MRTPHELPAPQPLAGGCVGREHTLAITRAGSVEEAAGGGAYDVVLGAEGGGGGGGGGAREERRAPTPKALQPLAGLLYRGFEDRQ